MGMRRHGEVRPNARASWRKDSTTDPETDEGPGTGGLGDAGFSPVPGEEPQPPEILQIKPKYLTYQEILPLLHALLSLTDNT